VIEALTPRVVVATVDETNNRGYYIAPPKGQRALPERYEIMKQQVNVLRRRTTGRTGRRKIASHQVQSSPQDLARHVIQFDADDPATYTSHTLPLASVMLAAARAPIPWPSGKEPRPAPLRPAPSPADPLPQFDYLIVTWTTEEGKALADTLTPGFASKTAWYPYTHKFEAEYVPLIRPGAPAVADSHRLGSYFPTSIAGKRVLCFKSELHMSQDGPKLPVAKLWQQLIAEVQPKLVITTGTAGGIGTAMELGDVVIARMVRFDCTAKFKSAPFHDSSYACSKLKNTSLPVAQRLFAANSGHLPPAARPPRIVTNALPGVKPPDVVTTDFFGFDDTTNHFGLEGLGATVEMGDAVLGMVVQQNAGAAPQWVAVRNASDPQIDSAGLTIKEAARKASQIYERFGYWTTIPSAITCWALILDN
jgi:Phosphorylase superfamily